jgi:hypothetical protein
MSEMLIIKNAVFIHIPKTGGTFIRDLIKENLEYETVETHDTVGHCSAARMAYYAPGKIPFCFVREPLSWFKSMVRYWTKYPNIRPDAMRALNNPFSFWSPFEQRILEVIHEGDFNNSLNFLLHYDKFLIYDIYSAMTCGVDFVGKKECLIYELCEFLNLINEEDYSHLLRVKMPPKNVTSEISLTPIDQNLVDEFYNIYNPLCERFGYETN